MRDKNRVRNNIHLCTEEGREEGAAGAPQQVNRWQEKWPGLLEGWTGIQSEVRDILYVRISIKRVTAPLVVRVRKPLEYPASFLAGWAAP